MADSTGRAKLNVGLIGLGRLGRVYARDLSTRIACTRLVAVADVDRSAVDRITGDFDIPRGTTDPGEVIGDPSVDAVVIVTPTSTHRDVTEAAAAAGKAVFCEKPLRSRWMRRSRYGEPSSGRVSSFRWGSCAGSIAASRLPNSGWPKASLGTPSSSSPRRETRSDRQWHADPGAAAA